MKRKKNDKRKCCKAVKQAKWRKGMEKSREYKENYKDKCQLGFQVPNCASELPEFREVNYLTRPCSQLFSGLPILPTFGDFYGLKNCGSHTGKKLFSVLEHQWTEI